MQLSGILLTSFAALGLAAPTTTPINTTTLIPRNTDEASKLCSDKHPAAANAITKVCALADLEIASNTISSTSDLADHDSVSASIHGACFADDFWGLFGKPAPAEDLSELCAPLMWQICAAAVETGRDVEYTRGKDGCQTWSITGSGFLVDLWAKNVGDLVVEPVGLVKRAAAEVESGSMVTAADVGLSQPPFVLKARSNDAGHD